MKNFSNQSNNRSHGFTIVELLIVIVVIAILAAISIVAYNGIQNRAHDTAIQNDLNNISKQIRQYVILNGSFPTGQTMLETLNIRVSKNAYGNHMPSGTGEYNLLYCWPNAANPNSFALIAASKSGNVYEYTSGQVRKAAYTFTGGSTGICTKAENTMDLGNNRDWFYSDTNWQPYISG